MKLTDVSRRTNLKEEAPNWLIRSSWLPGDMGAIILAHGEIIARECGFDHTFERYVAEGLIEFLKDSQPGNQIWLVDHQNSVLGSIALHVRSESIGQLRWFWLHPTLRGQGLGRLLLDRLLETARGLALTQIYLWTVEGLEASAHLYRASGFQLVQSEPKQLWGRQLCEQKYQLELIDRSD